MKRSILSAGLSLGFSALLLGCLDPNGSSDSDGDDNEKAGSSGTGTGGGGTGGADPTTTSTGAGGAEPPADDGCSCTAPGEQHNTNHAWLVLSGLALGIWRRRRVTS